MILCIGGILDGPQIDEVHALLADQTFADGGRTAGWAAGSVKNNEQLDPASPNYRALQDMLLARLAANSVFTLAAAPKHFRPLLISRYGAGMGYGDHVDNALMGDSPRSRSDISFTLFLSNPEDYESGELTIDDSSGARSYKLPAGSAILYPSTTLHRVETVVSGTRLVAVGWLQSMVRSAERRTILFDLETARRAMFQQSGKTAEFDLISKTTSNLWRMWSDT